MALETLISDYTLLSMLHHTTAAPPTSATFEFRACNKGVACRTRSNYLIHKTVMKKL